MPLNPPSLFQSLDYLVCGTTPREAMREGEARPAMARRIAAENDMAEAAVVIAHQVHGSRVVTVLGGGPAGAGEDAHDRLIAPPGAGGDFEASDADALVVTAPGILVGVFTADCTPIVIADPARRVAAAIHAGRESTRREIARRTVARMAALGARPASMLAWLGPSICADHYEVGAEMAVPFTRAFGRWLGAVGGPHGRHLDLAKINRMQLIEAGLLPEHIAHDERCTFEDETLCSYRRDGDAAGRMFTCVAMRA